MLKVGQDQFAKSLCAPNLVANVEFVHHPETVDAWVVGKERIVPFLFVPMIAVDMALAFCPEPVFVK